jgi:hypothetical protein
MPALFRLNGFRKLSIPARRSDRSAGPTEVRRADGVAKDAERIVPEHAEIALDHLPSLFDTDLARLLGAVVRPPDGIVGQVLEASRCAPTQAPTELIEFVPVCDPVLRVRARLHLPARCRRSRGCAPRCCGSGPRTTTRSRRWRRARWRKSCRRPGGRGAGRCPAGDGSSHARSGRRRRAPRRAART